MDQMNLMLPTVVLVDVWLVRALALKVLVLWVLLLRVASRTGRDPH